MSAPVTQATLACLCWPGAPAQAARLLRQYSPNVVDAQHALPADASGPKDVFFLDASGLVGLYASQAHWVRALRDAVRARGGGQASLLLGHHAHALTLLVRALPPAAVHVFATPAQEQRALQALPLTALGLPPQALQLARAMALQRLGEVMALPWAEVGARLGSALATLVDRLRRPGPKLGYVRPEAPCVRHWQPEEPCHDNVQLTFVGRSLLAALVEEARTRRAQMASVAWVLHFATSSSDPARPRVLRRVLHPARPSLELRVWGELLQLWLERLELRWPVVQMTAAASLVPPRWRQATLWPGTGRRDVARAHEALARVRATWGEQAVVRAELRPEHLPELAFAWTPVEPGAPLVPQGRGGAAKTLAQDPLGLGRWPRVRRVWPTPQPLSAALVRRLRQLPRGHPLAFWDGPAAQDLGLRPGFGDLAEGPRVVGALPAFWAGPTVYNHGWWQGAQDRDYLYASFGGAQGSALWWLYYARQQRRWFCHGTVD